MSDQLTLLLLRLFGLAALLSLIVIPILVIRARRRTARNVVRLYEGFDIRTDGVPRPGDVRLVFHTYSGFLAYVDQQTHNLVLPAEQARQLVTRMHWYNLKHGFFAYGALFIPLFSFFEWRSQLRKIDAQSRNESAGAARV